MKPFHPLKPANANTLNATTSSSSVTFTGTDITVASSIRVYNAGTVPVHIRWGVGAQTATTSDMRVAPGTIEIFYKGTAADTVAVITDAGSASIDITPGLGV